MSKFLLTGEEAKLDQAGGCQGAWPSHRGMHYKPGFAGSLPANNPHSQCSAHIIWCVLTEGWCQEHRSLTWSLGKFSIGFARVSLGGKARTAFSCPLLVQPSNVALEKWHLHFPGDLQLAYMAKLVCFHGTKRRCYRYFYFLLLGIVNPTELCETKLKLGLANASQVESKI